MCMEIQVIVMIVLGILDEFSDEPGSFILPYTHLHIIAFLSLSLHHWSTAVHPTNATFHMSLHNCSHMTLTFTSLDQPHLVDGHTMYNSHVYIYIFSYDMCPPIVWPIMNHHATWSGTYYSFTLDEPCACFLVYHLYLTCLYLPFNPEHCTFPQFSDLVLVPCLASHSPCPISH